MWLFLDSGYFNVQIQHLNMIYSDMGALTVAGWTSAKTKEGGKNNAFSRKKSLASQTDYHYYDSAE